MAVVTQADIMRVNMESIRNGLPPPRHLIAHNSGSHPSQVSPFTIRTLRCPSCVWTLIDLRGVFFYQSRDSIARSSECAWAFCLRPSENDFKSKVVIYPSSKPDVITAAIRHAAFEGAQQWMFQREAKSMVFEQKRRRINHSSGSDVSQ